MLLSAQSVMQRRGIESHVLSTGQEVGSYSEDLARLGVGIHHIPFSKSFGFFARLYRLLKQQSFDIVHIHTQRAYFFYTLVAYAASTPHIIRTVHHIFPWYGLLRWKNILFRHTCSKLIGCVFLSNSPAGLANEKRCYGMRNRLIHNWYNSDVYRARTVAEYKASRALL